MTVAPCPPDVESKGEFQFIGSFREVPAVKCQCGDSFRIKLSQIGWPFDAHLTKIRGGAEEHQHKRTPETYFIHRVYGSPTMTVGNTTFNLVEGMLISVPNGTMHSVEGDVDAFIIVSGGHKDDDFWGTNWNRLS